MRIVFDCRWIRTTETDGIGRYSLQILQSLLALGTGDRFSLLFHDEKMQAWVENQLGEFGAVGEWVKVKTPVLDPWEPFVLPRLLRQLKPDVFFSPNYLTYPFTAGVKTVLVVHDLIPYRFPEVRSNWTWKLFYGLPALIKPVLKRADALITVSEATRQEVNRFFGVGLNKMQCVWHGIDPLFFRRVDPQEISRLKTRYGIPEGEGYVLSLGRPQGYKNVGYLVDAWRLLPEELKWRFPLVLAGRKPETSGRVEEEVIRTGFVGDDDLPALYQGARVFVLPSRYEGFGFPVLEALAGGTRVLASDIPALREIGRDVVRFFPLDRPETLTQQLQQTLSLTDTLPARQSRQDYANGFKWEKTARQLMQIFHQVVGGSARD